MIRRLSTRRWLIVAPVALVLVLMLALSASAAPATDAVATAYAQTSGPACDTCHAVEAASWQESPHANAGATCESCHGEYQAGHPDGATMTLPMESETCRGCHEGTFTDWENSEHGDKNVDCYDCHLAHSQGLRIEPQEKLCSACHTQEETQLAHSVHGISGINCVACHMSPQTTTAADGSQQISASHMFTVASDICAGCHAGDIHSDASAKAAQKTVQAQEVVKAAAEQGERITELEEQVNADQQQIKNLRNLSVIAMGLTLGVGGALGLIVGVAAVALISRRKQS